MGEFFQVHTMITAPVSGMHVMDPQKWVVAIVVAKVMKTTLSKIIGVYDTDAKIIACYYEILFGPLSYLEVSRKYSINRGYMSKRLSELGDRLSDDPSLRSKMKSVGRMLLHCDEFKNLKA